MQVVHVLSLVAYGTTFSLTFIWCGWPGLFTILMVYSWIYAIFNGLFIAARHSQRLIPFRWPHLMLTYYISTAVALLLALTFFIVGCIHISEHDESLPYISPAEQKKYLVGRYMVALSTFTIVLGVCFTLYVREFKKLHIDEASNIQEDLNVKSNPTTDEDAEVNAHKY